MNKFQKFWKEYKAATNWKYAAIWFVLLNLFLWDKWNLKSFFLLILLFVVMSTYLWLTYRYMVKKQSTERKSDEKG